jgi:hypothetical protein
MKSNVGKRLHLGGVHKEVVESVVSRADPSGRGGTDSVKFANEP